MFDDLFKSLQDAVASKVQETVKDIEKLFSVPEAEEPFIPIHRFTVNDPTVEKDGITLIDETGWRIEAYGNKSDFLTINEPLRKAVLFEVAEPMVPECILACRFQARALKTKDNITVKLGRSEKSPLGTTIRYWSTSISPNEDFCTFEVRAHFKKNTNPAVAQIMIEFKSNGMLEIKDIELLQAFVKNNS
ncbi:hypothetical protein [Crocosphaera chwakensis]|uniref:Uncharacterized protein n=1 Tax=Crocosphaera chwakensis CCY0110 TaxID=391612 RepID=A3IS84_9CHRO|nr:hypothetical protein [Crocosphaera chwakensis]EAZ90600.1 hypothetical protein CY0110_07996 [Crocosphaera chwakensis CCY0110]